MLQSHVLLGECKGQSTIMDRQRSHFMSFSFGHEIIHQMPETGI